MKEALLYQKLTNNQVRCQACQHRCLINEGRRGVCGVRENKNGRLYSLVYGKLIALNIDPVEKKPLFHFLPGSQSLSLATAGCNFKCLNCQNADISQIGKDSKEIFGQEYSPKQIIEIALENKTPSISYTYTEPTVFVEYALDVMKLARQNGLKNIWVTNGYFTDETFKLISHYLDAVNVDLKFFSNELYQKVCGAKLQPVLDNLKLLKKHQTWLEITTLLIPGYTDQGKQLENIADFIKTELGLATPWHISTFYPAYKLMNISPTPVELVNRAYESGKKAGLKYVYVGNIYGDQRENTYCPKCSELNIERVNYGIRRLDKDGFCRKCGQNLNLVLK